MRRFWTGILAAGLLLSLLWGFNQYRLAQNYRTAMDNQNTRSLEDFGSHLDQLETDMSKGGVANTPGQSVYYLEQMRSHSDAASKDLAHFPADQAGLSYMGQFLTQTADFSHTLALRLASGGKVAPDEFKTLSDMHGRLLTVNRKVQDLLIRVNTENLAWSAAPRKLGLAFAPETLPVAEAAAEGQEGVPTSVRGGFDQLDASLQKLPPFNYTGEYSTRSTDKPLGLPAGEVTKDQAQSIAKDFLAKVGYPGVVPQFSGDIQEPFGGFAFQHGDAYVEVSRKGGVVRLYRDQRVLQTRTLNADEAKKKAITALQSMGWNLVLTSTEDFGSYMQIEAVSQDNGIRLYPDKVRIMVALDNGQITGYDATPYWAFHHARSFPSNRLTLSEAQSKLKSGFKITESRLALVPKAGNQEILCYEFRGKYQDEEFLVYINVVNGNEEKIQRIIRTPRGEYLQ